MGKGASVGVVVGLGVNVVEGQGQGHGRGRGQGQESAWVLVWPRTLMGVGKSLAGGVGMDEDEDLGEDVSKDGGLV